MTKKSTSRTLCYVDQFLLTSECRGQGTVALSIGKSELYALGALSADLIFRTNYPERDWTIIPDTLESRQQHSTRSGNETRSKSQDETHSHEILIQDLVFRKLLTMSSVMTDVNPSDIGTKAPGRERFHRLRSMLGMGTELCETSSPVKWYSGDD